MQNTLQFAKGYSANNALLWGAGMANRLVKAIHGAMNAQGHPLKIVELQREDLPTVGRLLNHFVATIALCCSAMISAFA